MLERRKKITKKQMKEDKLVTSYYTIKNFFLENQARILIGVAAIALVAVGVTLFMNKRASDNKIAAGLLAKLIPLYESSAFKDAIDGQPSSNTVGLNKIVDQYGSTENGETAKIYLANAYSMLGKNEEAYKMFNDYSGSNPLFKATSLAGKGGVLESKKEFDKAADLYQEAAKISKSNPANAEYLLRAGVNLLNSGKKDEAKTVFEMIKKDYKTSAAFSEIDRYIIQIES
ncbi:MAG: tetratricopeptide repeat protein [Ignavibacteriales bacterium]|nr:tetratricopeptide repeat protein [Ignavibacteriales bacterium]